MVPYTLILTSNKKNDHRKENTHKTAQRIARYATMHTNWNVLPRDATQSAVMPQ